MKVGYIFLGGHSVKHHIIIPLFLHIASRVWSHRWYTHMKTVRINVKPAINLQMKCLGTADCKYIENIFVYLARLNVKAKSPSQTIYTNRIWLYERDQNAPSTCSEPSGKQWQHSIRGSAYSSPLSWTAASVTLLVESGHACVTSTLPRTTKTDRIH